MQVLKPIWVSHDGLPIFCVDIHPDNSRFATGGQGTDSGRIVIWNLDTVLNAESEMDENIPKMLCQIDSHLACVNCVRWSNSGKFLASGGDDKLAMVWSFAKYSQGANAVFGSKGKVNVETWRCTSTLRGHNGDVLDMAWSPEDIWLATASVDNTIIIWDGSKLPDIITVLKGHAGLVKGVTWDPVGKYVSSQSEDRTLRIWRTIDWQIERVIQEPFENCPTTFALRHDWSPDGQYLVSAHAINNSAPTARIIERDGWKCNKDYVGHRKAVNCVRFSGHIVQKKMKKSGKELQMSVCALGSRDNGVSVWLTGMMRPLMVMENLFSGPVIDLSWSTTGLNLLACSMDGTVALLKFGENEIGKPLSREQKDLLFEKVYGTSSIGQRHTNSVIIENPVLEKLPSEMLKLTNGNASDLKNKPVQSSIPTKASLPVNRKQLETRTSDGKRRVTPICIALAPDIGENPVPFKPSNSSSTAFSVSSEGKSSIIIERSDDVVEPNVTSINSDELSKKKPVLEKEKLSTNEQISQKDTNGISSSIMNHKSWKRSLESSLTTVSAKQPRFVDVGVPQAATDRKIPVFCNEQNRIILLPMAVQKQTSVIVQGNKRAIILNESTTTAHGTLSSLKLTQNGENLWEHIFGSPVIGCVANNDIIVVTLENRTLFILESISGKHLLPPLVLNAKASHLSLNDTFLFCVTCIGSMNVWNIKTMKIVVSETSLASILVSQQTVEVNINKSLISKDGSPMIALSNGKAYFYSLDLQAWLQLGDNTDAVVCNSLQKMRQSVFRTSDRLENCPLHSLQSHSSNSSNGSRLLQNTEMNLRCTFTFLEQQLSAALILQTSIEFKHWLLTFVRFLVQHGEFQRLRLICEELLGPSHKNAKDPGDILGLPKRKLLREVLTEISSNVNAQRLYTEFSDQLKFLEEKNSD